MLNLGPARILRFFVGLDLGQVCDFSTLAVIDRVELKGEWDAAAFAWKKRIMLRLRHLERIPLGTPYPDVVSRVADVMRQVAAEGNCELVVDGTGVGRPVVDLLRRSGLPCNLRAAIVTGGISEHQSPTWGQGFRPVVSHASSVGQIGNLSGRAKLDLRAGNICAPNLGLTRISSSDSVDAKCWKETGLLCPLSCSVWHSRGWLSHRTWCYQKAREGKRWKTPARSAIPPSESPSNR